MARRAAVALVVASIAGAPVGEAFAQTGLVPIEPVPPRRSGGQSDAVLGVVQGLGTIGAVTTSVAAIVYAVQGRAFGSGWVVATLFSSAICAAASIRYATEVSNGGGEAVGMAVYALLALWPAGWTVWSALSGAEPGELLPPAGKAVPPDDGMRRPLYAPPAFFASIVSFRF